MDVGVENQAAESVYFGFFGIGNRNNSLGIRHMRFDILPQLFDLFEKIEVVNSLFVLDGQQKKVVV